MNSLETALVILVSIWSIIFIVLGLIAIFMMLQIKKALEKVNQILENAKEVSDEVGSSVKAVKTGLSVLAKGNMVSKIARKVLQSKRS